MRRSVTILTSAALVFAAMLVGPNTAETRSQCFVEATTYFSDATCTVTVGEAARGCGGWYSSWGQTSPYWSYQKDCICPGCSPCTDPNDPPGCCEDAWSTTCQGQENK